MRSHEAFRANASHDGADGRADCARLLHRDSASRRWEIPIALARREPMPRVRALFALRSMDDFDRTTFDPARRFIVQSQRARRALDAMRARPTSAGTSAANRFVMRTALASALALSALFV